MADVSARTMVLMIMVITVISIDLVASKKKTPRTTATETTASTTTVTTITTPTFLDDIRVIGNVDDDGYDDVIGSSVGGLPAKCVDIPVNTSSLCRGIGYTQMRLPNLLQHTTLAEMTQQASSWTPLLATKCHPDAQLFLCSLFSPVCLDQVIWPCRSLCEQVKLGCEPRMLANGFPWPKILSCDRLPSNDELCISPPSLNNSQSIGDKQTGQSSSAGNLTCPACRPLATSAAIQSQLCEADFVAKIKVEESVLVGSDLQITAAKKSKFYKKPTTSSSSGKKVRHTFFLDNAATCDCYDLATSSPPPSAGKKGKKVQKVQYILIGKQDSITERLTLTAVYRYDRQSKQEWKVLNALSRGNLCIVGRPLLTSSKSSSSSSSAISPSNVKTESETEDEDETEDARRLGLRPIDKNNRDKKQKKEKKQKELELAGADGREMKGKKGAKKHKGGVTNGDVEEGGNRKGNNKKMINADGGEEGGKRKGNDRILSNMEKEEGGRRNGHGKMNGEGKKHKGNRRRMNEDEDNEEDGGREEQDGNNRDREEGGKRKGNKRKMDGEKLTGGKRNGGHRKNDDNEEGGKWKGNKRRIDDEIGGQKKDKKTERERKQDRRGKSDESNRETGVPASL